eukprot:m.93104 g.93104  ORF g.93104 m.93104 type:complete len:222 (-) comp18303_c1_seq1:299-964(-)
MPSQSICSSVHFFRLPTTVKSVNLPLLTMPKEPRKSYTKLREPHFLSSLSIPERDQLDGKLIQEYDRLSKQQKSHTSLLPALSNLELQTLQAELDARSTVAEDGCILYDGNSGNGRGYIQLSKKTSRKIFWGSEAPSQRKFIATHVALATAGKLKESHLIKPQASHLCKNKRCVNAAHLVWEEEVVNQSRDNCQPFIEVTCPDCNKVLKASACGHSPPCLK